MLNGAERKELDMLAWRVMADLPFGMEDLKRLNFLLDKRGKT